MSRFHAGILVRVPCPLGMVAFDFIRIGSIAVSADGETVYRKTQCGWVESSKTPDDVRAQANKPGMGMAMIRVIVR